MFKDRLTTTLIIFCILVGGMLIFLILLSLTSKPTPIQPTPTPLPTSTPIPVRSEIKNKIPLGNVEVNNFLENPIQTNQSGDAMLVDTSRYKIVYLSINKEFLVLVDASPFDQVRKEAEQALLDTLGISKEQACQLTVVVYPPKDPENLVSKYPLSFCSTQ